jgi:hypothetical protein
VTPGNAHGTPNAMAAPNGDIFYPDDEHDARWFAEMHEAVPLWPDRFPFDIVEPVLRARVTLTFEVLASQSIEVTDGQLLMWVSDRLGRVTDNGPYAIRASPYGRQPEVYVPVSFGGIHDGSVEWVDGGAPEAGWHCSDCRQPKRPDAGRCQRTVLFRGAALPCGNDDADHHGSCSYRPPQLGRSASANGVS